MTLYEAIYAHAEAALELGQAGIKSYMGRTPSGQVATPVLLFSVVGGTNIVSHEGYSGATTWRIQVSGAAKEIAQASAARSAFNKVFQNYQGVMGGAGGVQVMSCLPTGSIRDLYDERYGWWLCQQDWYIMFVEQL
jgi:hypothetical protein